MENELMARTKDGSLGEIRKEQIFEGALKIISEQGSHNVTLAQIAVAAGLSKGGITYYYASKNDLFKDVFTNFFIKIFGKGQAGMDQNLDPLQKLLSFTWLFDENDPLIIHVYPLLIETMSLAIHDDEYRQLFHNMVIGWIKLLSAALQEGVAKKQFEITDIEGSARLISSIYQGIATRWYLDRESHTTEWAKTSISHTITKLLKP
jgi:AcrR family transcriptional regulator